MAALSPVGPTWRRCASTMDWRRALLHHAFCPYDANEACRSAGLAARPAGLLLHAAHYRCRACGCLGSHIAAAASLRVTSEGIALAPSQCQTIAPGHQHLDVHGRRTSQWKEQHYGAATLISLALGSTHG